jgi:outer membrane protein TolC
VRLMISVARVALGILSAQVPGSLSDAIARGLSANLGLLESAENVRTSRAQWLSSPSDLLPNVTARLSRTTEQIDLASRGLRAQASQASPFLHADARI